MDHNWNTDDLTSSDLSRVVIAIHLVAYPSPSMVDGYEPFEKTNHWCLFLEFEDNSSVRLEVTPGYGSDGLRGKVRLTSNTYACTSNNIKKVTYHLASTVSLEDLVSITQKNGRQKYQFADGWEGCRYWSYVFIQDLECRNILRPGVANQARDVMSWFYHSVHGAKRRSMKMGTFRH